MSSLTCSTTVNSNVFETGKYPTVVQKVEAEETRIIPVPPPKPLLIATPSEEGKFPVLVFSHGYLLYNSFYSQLLQHVASHGFIVIAPQVISLSPVSLSLEFVFLCCLLWWFWLLVKWDLWCLWKCFSWFVKFSAIWTCLNLQVFRCLIIGFTLEEGLGKVWWVLGNKDRWTEIGPSGCHYLIYFFNKISTC